MTQRVIRVVVDPSGADRGSRRVNKNLVSIDKNAKSSAQSLRRLTGAAAGFLGVFGAAKLIQSIDTYKQIRGQLDLVTDSYEQLNTVQSALLDIAQDTRQPLEATVSLYTRLARTTNFADAEIAALTKTIGQTIALSQAAPASAEAALFQLGQGFAAGALRGEELNSVMEQTPELAKAIADGLGVTVGQLRQLGQAGELTAERVQEALANVAEDVERDFQSLPLTVGQAVTQFQNAFTVFVGQLDSGVGAGNLLAETISNLADFLQNDALRIIERFGLQVDASFIQPIRAAAEEFSGAMLAIGENAGTVGEFIQEALSDIPVNIATIVKIAAVEIAAFIQTVQFEFEKFEIFSAKVVAAITRNEEAFQAAFKAGNELEGNIAGRAQARIDSIQAILDERDATIENVEIALRELEAKRAVIGELSNERRERAATAEVNAEVADSLDKLIGKIRQQTEELRLQNTLGDAAAEAIQRYRIEQQLAAVEGGALEDVVRQANEALIEQQRIANDIKLTQGDSAFIAQLEEELELLKLTNEERKIEVNLRRLSGLATEEQIDRVRSLSEEIAAQEGALEAQGDFIKRFRERAFDITSGTLADALTDGFDEVPAKFADLLQQLAAEALTAEIFKILTGFFTTGKGSGIGDFFGGLFGERRTGGTFRAGEPFIAGDGGRGTRPELILPSTSGRVLTANQTEGALGGGGPDVNVQITNVDDPKKVTDAINTNSGNEAVLNVLKSRASQVRKILR